MTETTTAPPGRVYCWDTKRTTNWAGFMSDVQAIYLLTERRPALWARVNPADLDRFAPLWPGAVVAEEAQLKGTIRLGRDL